AKWRQARNRSLKHQWSSTGVRTRARRLRQSNCYYTGERLQGETRFLTANLFCPFRALLFSTPDPIPRAMPWAGMSLPLRGEIQEAQLQDFRVGSWRHQRGRSLGLLGWHDIGGHPHFPGTRESVAPSAPPTDWLQIVNQPQTEAEVAALRCCLNRGRPFGDPNWVTDTA